MRERKQEVEEKKQNEHKNTHTFRIFIYKHEFPSSRRSPFLSFSLFQFDIAATVAALTTRLTGSRLITTKMLYFVLLLNLQINMANIILVFLSPKFELSFSRFIFVAST